MVKAKHSFSCEITCVNSCVKLHTNMVHTHACTHPHSHQPNTIFQPYFSVVFIRMLSGHRLPKGEWNWQAFFLSKKLFLPMLLCKQCGLQPCLKCWELSWCLAPAGHHFFPLDCANKLTCFLFGSSTSRVSMLQRSIRDVECLLFTSKFRLHSINIDLHC